MDDAVLVNGTIYVPMNAIEMSPINNQGLLAGMTSLCIALISFSYYLWKWLVGFVVFIGESRGIFSNKLHTGSKEEIEVDQVNKKWQTINGTATLCAMMFGLSIPSAIYLKTQTSLKLEQRWQGVGVIAAAALTSEISSFFKQEIATRSLQKKKEATLMANIVSGHPPAAAVVKATEKAPQV
uniref:Uncharacterized protein n=1 Tax=Compsopogon caeruleus TaxID=31354 RepID=A0A7S1TDN9_9RHOD|mmetsp:Transcript_2446/g.4233  ORF Transcript_2446/g.4233 Transcript_2446/m.4233 type:complete len:182 (+) Transcript_2446:292-837(+)